MAQYRIGKASVTNGSAIVIGSNTAWLSNVSRGDSFTIAGSSIIFDVADIQSDTQLTLTTNYSGSNVSEGVYAIVRDFTSPDNFPELTSGDIETPTILTRTIRKIQQKFNTIADIGFSEAVGLSNQATLYMDFGNNSYKLYEGLVNGITTKTFSQVLTHTRNSVANAHDALGGVSSVGVNDHRLTGNREGLLVEYSKTNLLLWSEDYSQSAWSKTGATIADMQDVDSPADKIVENTATGTHSVSQSVSLTAGTTYTFSVLLKADGRKKVTLEQGGAYTTNTFQFDLSTGTVTSQGDSRNYIKNVGEDWWLCVVTSEAASTGSGSHTIELNNDAGVRSYVGDGSSGVYVWGSQLETGEVASSYITTGSTTATRAADQVSRTFTSDINVTSGTLFAQVNLGSFTDTGETDSKLFEISNGTATGRISVRTLASGEVVADVVFGTDTYSMSIANSESVIKIAIAYTRDQVYLSVNGSVELVATTKRSENFSEMRLGWSVAGAGSMIGTFKTVWYLPVALSATDLTNATV